MAIDFNEKYLISRLQELKKIKPSTSWVVMKKKEILSREDSNLNPSFVSVIKGLIRKENRFVFSHKPAFAFLTILFALVGIFGFAQNSVPGDLLYSVRRTVESSQRILAEKELDYNIKMVNNRLDDLIKVVQNNATKNLAPTINEYQSAVSKVAKDIGKAESDNKEAMIKEISEIEKKTEQLKRTYGIEIGRNADFDVVLVQEMKDRLDGLEKEMLTEKDETMLMAQVEDLEARSLMEKQAELLEEIKADIEEGRYIEALEKLTNF